VVVEKPFVTSSAEADKLIALSKEKGKVLTVFHSQSYPPAPGCAQLEQR
jgi:predicted dehydrogenase